MNKQARILIVEDNDTIRNATRKALEAAGYLTFGAADGEEGIRLAHAERPDLILMDVNMPRMDGFEALRRIKSDPDLSAVYVIIVSGSRVDSDSQVRGLDTGAEGYLVRPISNRELVARVQSMLRIKQAEDLVRKREQQLRDLITRNVDGMLVVDADGRALFANPAACEMLNRSETNLSAKPVDFSFPSSGFSQMELPRLDGTKRVVELRVAEIEWQGHPARLASLRDITERHQAEQMRAEYAARLEAEVQERTRQLQEAQEKLLRQEKLAVLGQMAGSVGHELRNPLTVIGNAVYFLRLTQPDPDGKMKEYLDMIERETHLAGKIITDLLSFSHTRSAEAKPARILEMAQNVLKRFPPAEGIAVTLNLPADLPDVVVDSSQIEQVLGNLVLNACQAMPKGGQLTLEGRAVEANGQRWVCVTVRDTGAGIAPENMSKLFEPLFTTKAKGIGLGLAVSRMLAEANGSRIEIQSETGRGSAFTVWMPAWSG